MKFKHILCLLMTVCLLSAGLTCFASDEATATVTASASTAGVNENTDPIVINEGTTVLAFTGDQHGNTEGLGEWLDTVSNICGDSLALFSYSGDVCDKNWETDVYEGFMDMLNTEVPGRYNLTTGNQEFKSGAPGLAWDDEGEGFTRLGAAVETEDYIVYNIGAASEQMSFPDEDIEALAAYLDAVPDNIPVFVLSHYPLHLSVGNDEHEIPGPTGIREAENGAALLAVLNEHPNVIFLWGHNHTFADPRYGTIRGTGSAFTYTSEDPTEKITLNFTYANFGCFTRGDTYGLLAEVTRTDDGVQVALHFVDEDTYMTNKDSALLTIADDGTVTTEIIDGTDIDPDEILAMSGYPDDPNFAGEF